MVEIEITFKIFTFVPVFNVYVRQVPVNFHLEASTIHTYVTGSDKTDHFVHKVVSR